MRRRKFIALVGVAAVRPLPTLAQQPKKITRIGFLATQALESPDWSPVMFDAFRQGLAELGYMEGTNIIIELRAGEVERFRSLASELVRPGVDLIVATNSLAARAAQQATTTIPIVVPVMGDPVRDGLVASLARPGGNITGLTFLGPELLPKRLALLKEALPNISRVAPFGIPAHMASAR